MDFSTTAIGCVVRSVLAFLLLILVPASWAANPVRVAVFQGDGVGPSVTDLMAALENADNGTFALRRISADGIRSGGLSGADVLVHPGGSGSKQGKALGAKGRKVVREFVCGGGGFLGVCAGAYLATNDYSWSLGLIDAKVVDRLHWARGTGSVAVKLSPTACTFFSCANETALIYYGQGPLLARREWDDKDVPDYESLAIYDSEIAKNGAPHGVMKGTSAVVRARYGSGRVFCFSPHPEKTPGLQYMIPLAVRWLAGVAEECAVEVPEFRHVVRQHIPCGAPGGDCLRNAPNR